VDFIAALRNNFCQFVNLFFGQTFIEDKTDGGSYPKFGFSIRTAYVNMGPGLFAREK
jgi:hypothetical protein